MFPAASHFGGQHPLLGLLANLSNPPVMPSADELRALWLSSNNMTQAPASHEPAQSHVHKDMHTPQQPQSQSCLPACASCADHAMGRSTDLATLLQMYQHNLLGLGVPTWNQPAASVHDLATSLARAPPPPPPNQPIRTSNSANNSKHPYATPKFETKSTYSTHPYAKPNHNAAEKYSSYRKRPEQAQPRDNKPVTYSHNPEREKRYREIRESHYARSSSSQRSRGEDRERERQPQPQQDRHVKAWIQKSDEDRTRAMMDIARNVVSYGDYETMMMQAAGGYGGYYQDPTAQHSQAPPRPATQPEDLGPRPVYRAHQFKKKRRPWRVVQREPGYEKPTVY